MLGYHIHHKQEINALTSFITRIRVAQSSMEANQRQSRIFLNILHAHLAIVDRCLVYFTFNSIDHPSLPKVEYNFIALFTDLLKTTHSNSLLTTILTLQIDKCHWKRDLLKANKALSLKTTSIASDGWTIIAHQ